MKCEVCGEEGAQLLYPGRGWYHNECFPTNPLWEKLDKIIELLEKILNEV